MSIKDRLMTYAEVLEHESMKNILLLELVDA